MIFENFGKQNDFRGLNKEGCGLGIPVSKALSDTLGGSLTVKSVPGHGSTFVLAIPMCKTDFTEQVISSNRIKEDKKES